MVAPGHVELEEEVGLGDHDALSTSDGGRSGGTQYLHLSALSEGELEGAQA